MAQRKLVRRKTLKLQFRLDHPEDQHVLEVLEFWKGSKKRITNIRKAIALFYALEQGDDTLLKEMFPDRAGQGQPMFPDTANIVQALDRLNNTMERIQVPVPQMVEVVSTGKMLAAPKLDLPVFEDDDELPTIVTSKQSVNSAENLLKGLLSLRDEPPKVVVQKAREVDATTIADNFLSQFD